MPQKGGKSFAELYHCLVELASLHFDNVDASGGTAVTRRMLTCLEGFESLYHDQIINKVIQNATPLRGSMREFNLSSELYPKNGQIETHRNPGNGHLKVVDPRKWTHKVWGLKAASLVDILALEEFRYARETGGMYEFEGVQSGRSHRAQKQSIRRAC